MLTDYDVDIRADEAGHTATVTVQAHREYDAGAWLAEWSRITSGTCATRTEALHDLLAEVRDLIADQETERIAAGCDSPYDARAIADSIEELELLASGLHDALDEETR